MLKPSRLLSLSFLVGLLRALALVRHQIRRHDQPSRYRPGSIQLKRSPPPQPLNSKLKVSRNRAGKGLGATKMALFAFVSSAPGLIRLHLPPEVLFITCDVVSEHVPTLWRPS